MIKMIFPTIIMLSISLGCGPSQNELDQMKYEKEKAEKENLLYYPIPYDDFWRTYNANLIGAEGWISNKCSRIYIDNEWHDEKIAKKYVNKRVKVLHNHSKHSSWGKYKGNIELLIIEDNITARVDYNDFKPDFEKGDWLSNEYKEK